MRIFAFGESHVKYNYPTWADILLEDYEGYNCGEIGCSNQLISQRIVECDLKYNYNSDDILIINWANFFREDRFHTEKGWHCAGNVFNNLHMRPFVLNNYNYKHDAEWADLQYFLYRDLSSITLVQELLRKCNASVIQTHTGNFLEDEKFLDIPEVKKLIDFYKSSIIFDTISVQEFNFPNYNENTRPKYTYDSINFIVEDHPLPNEHLEWLKKIISEKYNLPISQDTIKWCNDWNKLIQQEQYILYPTNWVSKTPEWIL